MDVHVIEPASWCVYEYRACPADCVLEAAEGRLREAHRRWHEAAAAYQTPDDFRDAVNSCVQALRNVTFMVQAVKGRLPSFDAWYQEEQRRLQSDRVMRWVVRARNRVVKQGDLEAHSSLHVSVVTGYHDEARVAAREHRSWAELLESDPAVVTNTVADAPVAISPRDVLTKLGELDLPLTIRNDSAVLFERRWVVEDMPGDELLTLLAHAYGQLRSLVMRGHALLGLHAARVSIDKVEGRSRPDEEPEFLDELPLGGRLPCMVSSRAIRTARFRLLDGEEVQFFSDQVEPDPVLWADLARDKPYGEIPPRRDAELGDLQRITQLESLVEWYGDLAKGILQSGQDHGWFTYYFRKGTLVGNRVHMAPDAQAKQAIASEIARVVQEVDADAVILLSEVWISPHQVTPDGAHVPPGRHPGRTEALMVHGIAKSGVEANITIRFRVLDGEPPNRRVVLEEPVRDATTNIGILRPTLEVWGLARPRPRGHAFFKRDD